MRTLIQQLVNQYQADATSGGPKRPLSDPSAMMSRLARSLFEFGPLTPFLDGSLKYEELIIHGSNVMYVDADGRTLAWPDPVSEEEVTHVVHKLLATVGQAVDESRPVVQTQILGGTARIGVVLPPIADAIDVTIRRYLSKRESFQELIEWHSISEPAPACRRHDGHAHRGRRHRPARFGQDHPRECDAAGSTRPRSG